jgi:hypothetical protein
MTLVGKEKEDILTKEEIEAWKSFGDSLSSKEDRELFQNMLNDCYKYAAAYIQITVKEY